MKATKRDIELWKEALGKEISKRINCEERIETIKSKWQKRSKPIESNAITATAQQIKINKRQQDIGYQRAVKEILSDLGEK